MKTTKRHKHRRDKISSAYSGVPNTSGWFASHLDKCKICETIRWQTQEGEYDYQVRYFPAGVWERRLDKIKKAFSECEWSG